MQKLTEEYFLYPSRSELVRVAVREFLIKELRILDRFNDPKIDQVPKRMQNIDMRTIANFHRINRVLKSNPTSIGVVSHD
jgi:Arc/MetJ-type ribon-helix-helix transcriptional regulator